MLEPFAQSMLVTVAFMRVFALIVFMIYVFFDKDTTRRFVALVVALLVPNLITVGFGLVGP